MSHTEEDLGKKEQNCDGRKQKEALVPPTSRKKSPERMIQKLGRDGSTVIKTGMKYFFIYLYLRSI